MSEVSQETSLRAIGKGPKLAIIAIIAVVVIVGGAVLGLRYMENQRQTQSKESYESGLSALQSGNAQEAVDQLKKSVELNPNNDQAHVNLARGYTSIGNIKDAEKEYLASLKLNSNQPEAEYNLGVIYKSEKQYDKALVHFANAKKLNKSLYAADVMMAYVYRETGKFDQAITALNKVIESEPFGANMADLYVELGLAYKAKGDNANALKQWQEALNSDPANVRAKSLLAGK